MFCQLANCQKWAFLDDISGTLIGLVDISKGLSITIGEWWSRAYKSSSLDWSDSLTVWWSEADYQGLFSPISVQTSELLGTLSCVIKQHTQNGVMCLVCNQTKT